MYFKVRTRKRSLACWYTFEGQDICEKSSFGYLVHYEKLKRLSFFCTKWIFFAKEKYLALYLDFLRKMTNFAHWKANKMVSRFRKSPV